MRRPLAAWPALVLLTVAVAAACSAPPTSPFVLKRTAVNLDGDPVPCDSTVITDGTCRGGYIIPY